MLDQLYDLVKTYLYVWFLFDTKKSSTQHMRRADSRDAQSRACWWGTECSSLTRANPSRRGNNGMKRLTRNRIPAIAPDEGT